MGEVARRSGGAEGRDGSSDKSGSLARSPNVLDNFQNTIVDDVVKRQMYWCLVRIGTNGRGKAKNVEQCISRQRPYWRYNGYAAVKILGDLLASLLLKVGNVIQDSGFANVERRESGLYELKGIDGSSIRAYTTKFTMEWLNGNERIPSVHRQRIPPKDIFDRSENERLLHSQSAWLDAVEVKTKTGRRVATNSRLHQWQLQIRDSFPTLSNRPRRTELPHDYARNQPGMVGTSLIHCTLHAAEPNNLNDSARVPMTCRLWAEAKLDFGLSAYADIVKLGSGNFAIKIASRSSPTLCDSSYNVSVVQEPEQHQLCIDVVAKP
ncbi:hypothetical protein IW262DRAFT_1296024 [Armillaria fumosa]|nr:hypothetical protein IW262DRAFT_1296024 [Armillaria fumosa]